MKKIFSIFALMILTAMPVLLRAQPAGVDSSRIKRDIRIMEGILDRLLEQEKMNMRFTGDSRGFYIPDYGLIFYLRRIQPYQPYLLQQLEENMKQVVVTKKSADSVSERDRQPPPRSQKILSGDHFAAFEKAAEEAESNAMDALKAGISVFLSNYASSTSLLGKDDRIAVLVELDGWRTIAYRNGFLAAAINQKQAEALRKSGGIEKTTESPIKFELKTHNESLSRDIEILSDILDQAMVSGPTPRHAVTSGLYLDGLGALMVMDLQPDFWFGGLDTSFSIVIRQQGNGVSGVHYSAGREPQNKRQNETDRFRQLGDEIFDLIASYGHTLRIQPEEKIHIEVNMAPQIAFFPNQSSKPSTIRLQLVKRDVDAYNHGKIDLKELRKKLVLITL